MPRPLTKPPLYRLTLRPDAMAAFAQWLADRKPAKIPRISQRPDTMYDVAISFGLLDQLQTAARPKENLSATVLRIMGKN